MKCIINSQFSSPYCITILNNSYCWNYILAPSFASWTPLPPPTGHTYSSPYQGPSGYPSYQYQQRSYHQSSYQPHHDEYSTSSQSNYPRRDYNDPRGYHGDTSYDRYGTSRARGYRRSGGPLNEQRQQAYDPNMKREDYYVRCIKCSVYITTLFLIT